MTQPPAQQPLMQLSWASPRVFKAFMSDPRSHTIPLAAEEHIGRFIGLIMQSSEELFGENRMTLPNMVRAMLNLQTFLLEHGFFEELFRVCGDEQIEELLEKERARLRLYQYIVDNPNVLDTPYYAQLDRVVYAMDGSPDTLQAISMAMSEPEVYPWEVGDQFILQPRLLMMSTFAFPGIEVPE